MTLTPVQQRIYDLLSDGQRHTRDEVRACLYDDELGDDVRTQVSNLRRIIREYNLVIVCVVGNHPISYQMLRALVPVS